MKKGLLYPIIMILIIGAFLSITSLQSLAQYQSYPAFPSFFPYYTGTSYYQPYQYSTFPQYTFYPQTFPYIFGTQYGTFPSGIYGTYSGYQSTFNPFSSSLFPYSYSYPYLYPTSLYPSYSYPWYFPIYPSPIISSRTVPKVIGLPQADAEEDIIAVNLKVGKITMQYDPNIKAGYVISQKPIGGLTVPINSTVDITVSRGPQIKVALELVADGLTSPVGLVSPNDGSGRSFIVDQVGLIKILTADGEVLPEPFLDIRNKMGTLDESSDERGLLGLAFHPDYPTDERLFVYYSAPLRSGAPFGWDHTSHISSFTVDPTDPNKADPDSEDILLMVDQPKSNHNGGQLLFGLDDYLYISLGDGGGANDTGTGHNPDIGNGQDISDPFWGLLGSILRIDVDNVTSPLKYAIPSSNPFVGKFGLDEIYAFGFRNPFRMSFDAKGDHDLFVADVGQNLWEEVNIVKNGRNYGWNIKEGTHCFNPDNPNVSPSSCPNAGPNGITLRSPIIEFKNSNAQDGLSRAVIGGYVYRGSFMSILYGRYVFGGWSTTGKADGTLFVATPPPEDGVLWPMGEIQVATSKNNRLKEYVLSFGEDPNNELYVLTSEKAGPSEKTGKVYRMVPSSGSIPFVNVFDQTITPLDMVKIAATGYDGPGWIVIHDPNAVIIGYTQLDPGINIDVTVDLSRNAKDGEVLLAMLHMDANVIGTFEFPGLDTPVIGDRGLVVERSFTVTHCTNPKVPNVKGMTQAEAEEEITSCNLLVGDITLGYSNTVDTGKVINQTPAAGTTVSAGTEVDLLISIGSVSFDLYIQPIFDARCVVCHNVLGMAKEVLWLNSDVSYDNLVDQPATHTGSPVSGIRVIRYNSEDSVLYQRVSGIGLPSGESIMPLGGPPISPTAQENIRQWIDDGAF